jgi:hypothetical protein
MESRRLKAETLYAWLGGAIISGAMSGVMSGVMIAINIGLTPDFLIGWLRSWGIGFVVSFPTAQLVVPPVIRWQMRRSTAFATPRA